VLGWRRRLVASKWIYPDRGVTSTAFAAAVRPPLEAKLITMSSGGHGLGNT
jgi:hypothetical protein